MKPTSSQHSLRDKTYLILLLTLLIHSCNFRIENYKELETNSSIYFDNNPPNPYIISPISLSVISGRVSFIGRTEDDSSTITYVSFGLTNLIFSNSSDWGFEVNTYDLTNGPLNIIVYAEDSLKNKSENKTYRYYISNSLQVIVSHRGIVTTNTNFLVSIQITSTNYSSLKIYTNNHLYLNTNSVRNIVLELETTRFDEFTTNTLTVVVDEITNTLQFVFDLTPPNITVLLSSNSYAYGSQFTIPVVVIDTNATQTYLAYGGLTNTFTTTNGTNFLVLDTFLINNGTNNIVFYSKDEAGNTSSIVVIPFVVANFYSQDINIINNYYYYFVNSEVVSNGIYLVFIRNNFSTAHISREENNFQRETIKQTITTSPSGKLRTIHDGSKIILGHIRDDENLIIRTNYQITNYYQLANLGLVRDFEFCSITNKVFVLRLTQSGHLVITDVSNRTTNFITNLLGGSLIGVDKYPIDRLLYSVSKDNTVMLFTNNRITFTTNFNDVSKLVITSLNNGFSYLGVGETNRIHIIIFSNFSYITNYSFSGRFVDLCVDRRNESSIFCVVERTPSTEDRVRLVEFRGVSILRDQLLPYTLYTYASWKDCSISIADQQINIFIPVFYENTGSIRRLIGL
ncbi:MAG: hypothetical protein RMJ37_02805 [Spirochaetia bacterium]|nr:hypothetical protein [Spirochaetota bacterium]MCX8095908.1 hypothetical protein [Spirochaetota bacterium]MDW8112256.1 hypothetical protein [Spirochaetia bacterium]